MMFTTDLSEGGDLEFSHMIPCLHAKSLINPLSDPSSYWNPLVGGASTSGWIHSQERNV